MCLSVTPVGRGVRCCRRDVGSGNLGPHVQKPECDHSLLSSLQRTVSIPSFILLSYVSRFEK